MNNPTTREFRRRYIVLGEQRGALDEVNRCIALLEYATGSPDPEAALLECIVKCQARADELTAACRREATTETSVNATAPRATNAVTPALQQHEDFSSRVADEVERLTHGGGVREIWE